MNVESGFCRTWDVHSCKRVIRGAVALHPEATRTLQRALARPCPRGVACSFQRAVAFDEEGRQ